MLQCFKTIMFNIVPKGRDLFQSTQNDFINMTSKG